MMLDAAAPGADALPGMLRPTMNWSDACASVRIQGGAVLGKGAVNALEAAPSSSRMSAPGAGAAVSAVAIEIDRTMRAQIGG